MVARLLFATDNALGEVKVPHRLFQGFVLGRDRSTRGAWRPQCLLLHWKKAGPPGAWGGVSRPCAVPPIQMGPVGWTRLLRPASLFRTPLEHFNYRGFIVPLMLLILGAKGSCHLD